MDGKKYEDMARQYLLDNRCHVLMQNYHSRFGEIDLIAKEGDALLFVEVRYRADSQYGGAVYSITQAKRSKLIKTAQQYLIEQKLNEQSPCRFDVILLDGTLQIEWIKNAFQLM